MPEKTIKVEDLPRALKELRYSLTYGISLTLSNNGKQWTVYENMGGGLNDRIRLFDGTMAGGTFPTLQKAQEEVARIFQFFITPIKRKHIVRHFGKKWIRKEEQPDELLAFRQALIAGRWKDAQKIYNRKLSNWTKEAVPNIVVFQIARNLVMASSKKKKR